MSEVELNGQRYKIKGAVKEEQVSPFAPQISSGNVEFSNFQPCSVWEKKDLRGGMGMFREETPTNRYFWAENMNLTKNGYWTLGPLKTTAGSFGAACSILIEFESVLYGFGASKSQYWSGSAWTTTGDASPFAVAPTDAITFSDDSDHYLLIANGGAIRYCSVGYGASQDWAQLTSQNITYMSVMDNRWFGVRLSPPTVYYCPYGDVDGTLKSFKINAEYNTITDFYTGKLQDGTDALFINTDRGIYSIDWNKEAIYPYHTHQHQLYSSTPEGFYWGDSNYVGTDEGMLKIGDSVIDWGADQDDGFNLYRRGYPYKLTRTNNWIIMGQYGAGYVSTDNRFSILARHVSMGGWHPIYTGTASTQYCTSLLYRRTTASSFYDWITFGEGTNVYYLLVKEQNLSLSTYAATGHVILPVMSALSSIPKIALKVVGLTDGVNTGDTIAVKYRTDGDIVDNDISSSWTTLDTWNTVVASGLHESEFASGAGEAFKEIQFRLDFTNSTGSPKLISFAFYYDLKPARVSQWTFEVKAEGLRAKEYIDALTTAIDNTVLNVFYPDGDSTGTAKYVKVIAPSKQFLDEHKKEKAFRVTVTEVI